MLIMEGFQQVPPIQSVPKQRRKMPTLASAKKFSGATVGMGLTPHGG